MRAGKTEWAHALAGGLSVRGAEGFFAGLTANVPEAGETKKESHRTMKLFHGERIIASITYGKSLSVLRI